MQGFTNENVMKEYHRLRNMALIGIFLVVVAILFILYGVYKNSSPEAISLAGQMESGLQTDEYAYIDVTAEPYGFAYFEGEEDYYFYYVFDENYMYVVRMRDNTYESFLTDDLLENPKRISGMTKTIPEDIKEIAIEVYNEEMEEEDQITSGDFTRYFNDVYLDAEALPLTETDVFVIIGVVVITVGAIVLLCGGVMLMRYKKNIKKLTNEDIEKIDQELNDKETFFYKTAHAALTKNYVVHFGNTFEAILYQDIIWIYPYEIRQRGVKTSQSIQIMTNDGKMHGIASMGTYTKKSREIYEEIFDTIVKKCPNALVGFTKENKKLAKEKIKK